MNIQSRSRRRNRGFTLVELLVALVIMAIIMGLAIPAYMQYARKANRSDVKAILMETAQFMERYYTTNKTYLGAALLTSVAPKAATGTAIKYNLDFSVTPSATAYTLRAIPANAQASDTCGTLTLSNTGAQTAATANCW